MFPPQSTTASFLASVLDGGQRTADEIAEVAAKVSAGFREESLAKRAEIHAEILEKIKALESAFVRRETHSITSLMMHMLRCCSSVGHQWAVC